MISILTLTCGDGPLAGKRIQYTGRALDLFPFATRVALRFHDPRGRSRAHVYQFKQVDPAAGGKVTVEARFVATTDGTAGVPAQKPAPAVIAQPPRRRDAESPAPAAAKTS